MSGGSGHRSEARPGAAEGVGAPPRPEPLLEVRDLGVHFPGPQGSGPARAVDGVSFTLWPAETLGLVGESGCGKSLTALSLARLVDEPPARTTPESSIRWRGEELVGASPRRLRQIRGAEIGFVFQEPMTSLNPVKRVGDQVAESLVTHERLSRAEARARARDLLARVELPDPERAARAYPHELSGGMRQRALIAIAIACGPSLLIADEPTTALDVTVQAQILDLLDQLRRESGMALLLISHDLAVVSSVADRVAVMYAGQIVETAPAPLIFGAPAHPYTEGLLRAVPSIEDPGRGLAMIPGSVPAPGAWPPACRFHPRCPYAWDRCAESPPPLEPAARAGGERRGTGPGDEPAATGAGGRHLTRCWLAEEPARRAGRGYAEAGA